MHNATFVVLSEESTSILQELSLVCQRPTTLANLQPADRTLVVTILEGGKRGECEVVLSPRTDARMNEKGQLMVSIQDDDGKFPVLIDMEAGQPHAIHLFRAYGERLKARTSMISASQHVAA